MQPVRLDVWSDIACPWCYVGKRRLETALARSAVRDAVELVWRSFELDPSAPPVPATGGSYAGRLARKYGTSVARAEGMIASLTDVAAADGIEMCFDRIRPGNTFDAHRLLHLARERGAQAALKERLLRAYFTEGEPIGDRETLARLAGEATLDPAQARRVLASDQYAREVRADEAEAQAIGVTGVPFFVFDQRYGVSGAQPVEVLLEVLDRVQRDAAQRPAAPRRDDESLCRPDGCD